MSENVDWSSIPAETVESVPDFKASEEKAESVVNKTRRKVRERAAAKEAASAPRARRTTKRASAPKKGAYKETLQEMYAYVGMGIMIVDPTCGNAVIESAEQCAQSLDDLAYTNESVRRVLDTLTQGSAIGAVIMAHLPIVMAVAAHHGGLNKLGGLIVGAQSEDGNNADIPAP